jgi:hypothetical protein
MEISCEMHNIYFSFLKINFFILILNQINLSQLQATTPLDINFNLQQCIITQFMSLLGKKELLSINLMIKLKPSIKNFNLTLVKGKTVTSTG